MWNDLDEPWKVAFELAWEAFRNDSIPIGAVIYKDRKKVSCGMNRIFETNSEHPLAGLYMGHAEMDAMIKLKGYTDEEIRGFTIYSTMEPCPMCFSTMYMMHLKGLKYASHDKFAGSTNIYNSTWYFKQKSMDIEYVGGELQAFQLVLQTGHECLRKGMHTVVTERWMLDDSMAVSLGMQLHDEGYFVKSRSSRLVNEVYNEVITRYRIMQKED